MLTLRWRGETQVTSSPSRITAPSLGSSKPAIIRSVVVLPQPLGPSIEKNSPRGDLERHRVGGDRAAVALGQAPQLDHRPHRCHSLPAPIAITNRSLTLVPVEPVRTRSPSAADGSPERWASRAWRRSRPSVAGAGDGHPVGHRPGGGGAAVGAVGVDHHRGDRAAVELQRGGDRRVLVRPAGAELGALGEAHRGLAAAADEQDRRRERGAVGGAGPRQVGEQAAELARLPLEAGREADGGVAGARRLQHHRLAGAAAGDQQLGLDPRRAQVGRLGGGVVQMLADRSRHPLPEVVGLEHGAARRRRCVVSATVGSVIMSSASPATSETVRLKIRAGAAAAREPPALDQRRRACGPC